jgi:hypothetical protein
MDAMTTMLQPHAATAATAIGLSISCAPHFSLGRAKPSAEARSRAHRVKRLC